MSNINTSTKTALPTLKNLRLHNELNVNLEGIDVVLNLLKKKRVLRDEVNALKNRLRLYEG